MEEHKNYKKTLITCYLGFITQSITANFTPLLFLRFHTEYGIPFGQIALIPIIFYVIQILVDIFCTKFADRSGYRLCVVISQIASAAGLVGLTFLPEFSVYPIVGIIISVIIYSVGSGLVEVLVSPIVEACPFDNKKNVMSLLHSFYCWGVVGVVVISTLFFSMFGIENWRIMAFVFALIPLVNAYNFMVCPIERLTDDSHGFTLKKLMRQPLLWLFVILMVGAGASEASMAQWASAYAEAALGFDKSVGDLVGPCMFALSMGLSRMLYGSLGQKIDLSGFMLGSGVLCLICYLLAAISVNPVIGLVGCIVCGFSVGIMWPGSISMASEKIPLGGTVLFALLAMGGDLGASVGPGVIGAVTQNTGNDMRAGMLTGCVFPVALIIAVCLIKFLFVEKENRS